MAKVRCADPCKPGRVRAPIFHRYSDYSKPCLHPIPNMESRNRHRTPYLASCCDHGSILYMYKYIYTQQPSLGRSGPSWRRSLRQKRPSSVDCIGQAPRPDNLDLLLPTERVVCLGDGRSHPYADIFIVILCTTLPASGCRDDQGVRAPLSQTRCIGISDCIRLRVAWTHPSSHSATGGMRSNGGQRARERVSGRGYAWSLSQKTRCRRDKSELNFGSGQS